MRWLWLGIILSVCGLSGLFGMVWQAQGERLSEVQADYEALLRQEWRITVPAPSFAVVPAPVLGPALWALGGPGPTTISADLRATWPLHKKR